MRIAVIGVGRWGTNIVRTLEGLGGVQVLTFSKHSSPLTPAKARDKNVTAVVVATPGSTHARIALPFISAGMPVFIEKPMTTSRRDAERLEHAASQSGAIVFVGHVQLYNPAYLQLKQLVDEIGHIRALRFTGLNQGPVRDDMSVLWDWGPHGVSMALDLLGEIPQSVQAWGVNVLKPKTRLYDEVVVKLNFARHVEMLLHMSWLGPDKIVKLTVVGSKQSVVFDDTLDTKKVALYSDGEVHYPRYSRRLPLTRELEAWLKAVRSGRQPHTDINNGVAVVKVLAAAEQSIAGGGQQAIV